jgi:hypothetical protein
LRCSVGNLIAEGTREKARRADSFIVWRFKNKQSSVQERHHPNMPHRRRWNFVWIVVLQVCRAYGANPCYFGVALSLWLNHRGTASTLQKSELTHVGCHPQIHGRGGAKNGLKLAKNRA